MNGKICCEAPIDILKKKVYIEGFQIPGVHYNNSASPGHLSLNRKLETGAHVKSSRAYQHLCEVYHTSRPGHGIFDNSCIFFQDISKTQMVSCEM